MRIGCYITVEQSQLGK